MTSAYQSPSAPCPSRVPSVAGARLLFVAIPDAFEAGQIVAQARAANPRLRIIARAHSDAEVEHLRHHGADTIIMGEREIALGMLKHALEGQAEPGAAQPSPEPSPAGGRG